MVQKFLKHDVVSVNFLNFGVAESIIAIELTFLILVLFNKKLQVIRLSSRRMAILNKVMFPVFLIINFKFCAQLKQFKIVGLINKLMYTFLTFH